MGVRERVVKPATELSVPVFFVSISAVRLSFAGEIIFGGEYVESGILVERE
jgi:hypothetical protein